MPKYYFHCKKGEVRIRYAGGQWVLDMFGKPIGAYRSASAAAWDVADHRTGLAEWDTQADAVAPASINGWNVD